jgi:adenylate cyclase class 2
MAANKVETEIKLKIVEFDEIKRKLLSLRFQLNEKEYFETNAVFDTPEQRLRKLGILLRLRRKGAQTVLTLKTAVDPELKNKDYKIKNEIESIVNNGDNIQNILLALGFEVFFIYEKFREIYRRNDMIVTLDRTPIGNYIEIEGVQDKIDEIAQALGYVKCQYITDSYYTLFRKVKKSGHMVFE